MAVCTLIHNADAVSYLESHAYEHLCRPSPIRDDLLGIREDDWVSLTADRGVGAYLRRVAMDPADIDDSHAHRFCDQLEALCSGDGFRWAPGDPVARFT